MRSQIVKNVIRAIAPRELRNWLRSPSKSAESVWDSIRFRVGSIRTLELAEGWTVVCHPHTYKVFARDQLADPEQSLEFRNFVSHCSDDMFLFDVGAHFGVFSLAAAHFGGKALAVDPSPMATQMIAVQAKLNNCVDKIRILQATVTNRSGIAPMLSSGIFSDGYFRAARGRRDLKPTKAKTIDEMAKEIGAPTHIKIDVEGHEAEVICGARLTLRQFSPLLFLELHNEMVISDRGDPRLVLDELVQLGHNTFGLDGKSISRSAILKRPSTRLVAKFVG